MSKQTARIACVGGFLGAGKTTAILRAGLDLKRRGMKVGIITNDQGSHLVDTALMRDFDFPAQEVVGGCFCCQFPEFVKHARELLQRHEPDLLLTEPVGSCTDLSASVYKRLRRYHSAQFQLAPLTVVVEPARLRQFARPSMGFDESVRYLFRQQVAEADLILLNKSDLLSRAEIEELKGRVLEFAGDVPVLAVSAKTDDGIADWVQRLMTGASNNRQIHLDYDLYGQAEASLGWLNANLDLNSEVEFSPFGVGDALVSKIQLGCENERKAIAHLKIMFVTEHGNDWIALTDEKGTAAWGKGGPWPLSRNASVIVNLRASADPQELRQIVVNSLQETVAKRGIQIRFWEVQAFSPSPPVPPSDDYLPQQA